MKELFLRVLRAALGLVICAFGTYLTIQANVGLAPWDCLNMGISGGTGISFGTASILVGVLVVVADLALGERIGVGTLMDAFLVGASVDAFTELRVLPKLGGPVWLGLLILVAGLFLVAVGQYVYMGAGLCCGPRDSLLVGLGKRLRKWPIGAVSVLIQVIVLAAGVLLGGPAGLGTVASVVLLGGVVQLVFRLLRFEPRDVVQESLTTTVKSLLPMHRKVRSR